MSETKKSYVDLYLDNVLSEKKRGEYFEEREERAIVEFNTETTSERRKYELFEKIIKPGLRNVINGVLEMRIFRSINQKKINKEELIEETYGRLIEKLHKFTPGLIGKNGQPVKAFSYFSTITKHFIIEKLKRHDKILKNKADVETSIDLSILSEDTLENITKNEKTEIVFEDFISSFKETKFIVLNVILEIINYEEAQDKKDEDYIKLLYHLKYILSKWGKIEFEKKNEFMRILTLYTGFSQQKVSVLFKRVKMEVIRKLNPNSTLLNKKKDLDDDYEVKVSEVEDEEETSLEELLQSPEDLEEKRLLSYDISSFEEFEAREYKLGNINSKREWKEKTK